MAIIAIIFVAALSAFMISAMSYSLAKHKTQAIYAAQQAIETLRKQPYANIAGSTSAVIIDSKGTDNLSDDFNGTQTITVYTDAGVQYCKRVVADIGWKEIIFGKSRTMHESCGTYIANDPQAN